MLVEQRQERFDVQAEAVGVGSQEGSGVDRRRQVGEVFLFEREEKRRADARLLSDLAQRQTVCLARLTERLADADRLAGDSISAGPTH